MVRRHGRTGRDGGGVGVRLRVIVSAALLGGDKSLDHVSGLTELSNLLLHSHAASGRSPSSSALSEHGLLLLVLVVVGEECTDGGLEGRSGS